MKIVTFKRSDSDDGHRIGSMVSESEIRDLTHLVSSGGLTEREVLSCFNLDLGIFDSARDVGRAPLLDRNDVTLCAAVPRPGKIICIGLNYRDHAAESGMPLPSSPVIFSKFNACAIGPRQPIVIPRGSTQTDYEAELAFVIGRRAKDVSRDDAFRYIFGYTNFNDVSARDFQFADGQWQRGKSCDTFAPMGPCVVTTDEIPDPQNLPIKLRLNGETMQDSNTCQMVFGVAELVEFLSGFITLEPGDVIATGTPPGVGFARTPPVYLRAGDIVEVEIDGLGVLSNSVLGGSD